MPTSLTPPSAPPVDQIDGLVVVWSGWQLRRPAQLRARCPRRGCSPRSQWVAYGRTDPAHGEVVNGVRVTAWPTLRLVALSCPTCGPVRVFDLSGDGWATVPVQAGTVQLSLFPEQQRWSA